MITTIITTQRKRRLAVLCVICITCVTFLGLTVSVNADSVAQPLANTFVNAPATTYSPERSYRFGVEMTSHQVHPLHSNRSWQITSMEDIFANAVVAEPATHMSVISTNQPLNSVTAETQYIEEDVALKPVTSSVTDSVFAETQYIGEGVALIPDYNYSVHRNRDWKISHF